MQTCSGELRTAPSNFSLQRAAPCHTPVRVCPCCKVAFHPHRTVLFPNSAGTTPENRKPVSRSQTRIGYQCVVAFVETVVTPAWTAGKSEGVREVGLSADVIVYRKTSETEKKRNSRSKKNVYT